MCQLDNDMRLLEHYKVKSDLLNIHGYDGNKTNVYTYFKIKEKKQ